MIGPLEITTPAAWVPMLRFIPSNLRATSTQFFTVGSLSYSFLKSGTVIASARSSEMAPFMGTSLHM